VTTFSVLPCKRISFRGNAKHPFPASANCVCIIRLLTGAQLMRDVRREI
jgi:hypothetical protein